MSYENHILIVIILKCIIYSMYLYYTCRKINNTYDLPTKEIYKIAIKICNNNNTYIII